MNDFFFLEYWIGKWDAENWEKVITCWENEEKKLRILKKAICIVGFIFLVCVGGCLRFAQGEKLSI